jgi:hypothetical protein
MTRILPIYSIAALALLTAPYASLAQEEEAVPRESVQEPVTQPPEPRAVPRGSRPQGDNPQTGTAVPRSTRPAPAPPQASAPPPAPLDPGRAAAVPRRGPVPPRTVIVPPPVYNNYYYSPRRYYPYGYGAFGLGYFYYDPYTWYPGYSAYPPSGFGRPYSVFDVGELRLQVTPRHAQVFVDGYYAGTVDDYDGILQSMKMESGPYHIDITAPGYETLAFDIRINPGQKITYRWDLRRRP